jgi:porin
VNNHGYYVLTEHSFAKGMTAFVRYGVANGEANIFDSCLGTGVQWIGLIPSREADRLGLAYVRAHASGAYKESVIQNGDPTPEDSESVIEVTYRAQINDHVALQPDYQWVFDPGVNPQLDNAQVFGLRLELGF